MNSCCLRVQYTTISLGVSFQQLSNTNAEYCVMSNLSLIVTVFLISRKRQVTIAPCYQFIAAIMSLRLYITSAESLLLIAIPKRDVSAVSSPCTCLCVGNVIKREFIML